jgi:hypothetical protein
MPHDPSPNKEAIAMLERSLGMDASYAPAWEALGVRYYYDTTYSNGGEEMIQRSNNALERALTLDPDLIVAATQLTANRVERRQPARAYQDARALIKQHPENPYAHFTLGYVLRYAGMLEESERECDAALALDPGNYQYRSCTLSFAQMGKTERARDFIRLDAGSEWATYMMPQVLLREGKRDETRAVLANVSSNPRYHRDMLDACLEGRGADLDRLAHQAAGNTSAQVDPEPLYYQASIVAFCGKKESALSLVKIAIDRDYCAYDALQRDPLWSQLRNAPEFPSLLAAARQCQQRYLVGQN